MKPGDWTCPECQAHVFAKNKECWECGKWRPIKKVGDWTCNRCGDNVFASKTNCRCGNPKPISSGSSFSESPSSSSGSSSSSPQKSPPQAKAGDWTCSKCNDNVFASRTHCRCGQSRNTDHPEKCVVCLDNPKEMLIKTCNHICVCHQCITSLKICPVCRKSIASSERVFIS